MRTGSRPDDPVYLDSKLANPEPETLLNKSHAARYLGISRSEFIRREGLDVYKPTVINERGWSLYSVEYLDSVKNITNVSAINPALSMKVGLESRRSTNYDGDLSAQVFEEIDNKTKPVDIVKKFKIHPAVMQAIFSDYIALQSIQEGFYVSPKIVRMIEQLGLEGSYPIRNAEQLLANLQLIAKNSSPVCIKCKKKPRQFCLNCAVLENDKDGKR